MAISVFGSSFLQPPCISTPKNRTACTAMILNTATRTLDLAVPVCCCREPCGTNGLGLFADILLLGSLILVFGLATGRIIRIILPDNCQMVQIQLYRFNSFTFQHTTNWAAHCLTTSHCALYVLDRLSKHVTPVLIVLKHVKARAGR